MANKAVKKKQGLVYSILEFIFLLLVVFLVRTFGFGLYQVPTGSMETTMLVGERFFANKLVYWYSKPHRSDIIAFNAPPQFYKYSDNAFMNLFQRFVWGPDNWTKRVIGIPGDKIRGAIEDNKPVIYVNDNKLDEPYLNKYTLIRVWREDPAKLYAQIEQEIARTFATRQVDQQALNKIIEHHFAGQTVLKSYDPALPYNKQPFYNIRPERLVRGAAGELDTWVPGTAVMPNSGHGTRVECGKSYWDGSDEFYVELGADEYWLMGDNRGGSKDCRVFGPVPGKLIHGKIVFRIWSVDSDESWWILDLIKHPIDFWKRVRWSRFFQTVK